ncbi:MAG: hypothetical protein ACR2NP_10210 [Pirellulaceae bacterium]
MTTTPKGKSVSEYHPGKTDPSAPGIGKVLVPYLILAVTMLPLSFIYLLGLWSQRGHYLLFPVCFLATALFLFLRWPRRDEPLFFSNTKSDVFFVLGIFLAVVATAAGSPWFGFASILSLTASLLARTNDRSVFGTLLPCLAPLVVILQPPFAIDFDSVQSDLQLMSVINISSAQFASGILDLLGYVHNIAGSRLELPTQIIDTSAINNRSVSVFSLLMLTGIFIAWMRRPLVRAALLLLAACFWAMAFQAFLVVIFAIGVSSFEQDLFSPGPTNRMLQGLALLLAGLFTVLSDQLITFVCGPVDITAIDEDISWQDKLCRFWNSAIWGVTSPVIDVNIKSEVAWAKRRNSPPSATTSTMLWGGCVLLGILALLQVLAIASAGSRQGRSVYSATDVLQLSESSLPDQFDSRFACIEYSSADPVKFNPFETRRDHWVYADALDNRFDVVIHQPWSGWYETLDRKASGDWKEESDPDFQRIKFGDETSIELLVITLQNNLAETQHLRSAQIDSFGRMFERPLTWSNPGDFLRRFGNRLGLRSDPRMMNFRCIEISVSLTHIQPPADAAFENLDQLTRLVIQHVQTSVQDGTLTGGGSAP